MVIFGGRQVSGGEDPTLVGTWNSLALTDAASIRQGGASWSQSGLVNTGLGILLYMSYRR